MLINSNALHIPLADKSVNMCVTSPPYYGLRDYGTAEWIGGKEIHEECPECHGNVPIERGPTGWHCETCHGTGYLVVPCDHKIPDVEHGNIIGKSNGKDNQNSHTVRFNRDKCYKCGAIRVDNQIGLEQTPDEYIANLVTVFREVWRVMRDDGTLWVNIGDSYASMKSRYNQKPQNINGGKAQDNEFHGNKTDLYHHKELGLKDKDLIGIPWMLAFALRADGWYLRSDIIWAKRNCMPESVKDRPTKSHEYIFLLSKSKKYYYDHEEIKEPSKDPTDNRGERGNRKRFPTDKISGIRGPGVYPKRNKRDVWFVSTKPYKGAHYATFNPELITPCILAGCPEGGIVLDPFVGSGTTVATAIEHNRKGIGLDLSLTYLVENAKVRIGKVQPEMAL